MSHSDDVVLVETRDHKMFITLNRPEVLNAQNMPMRNALVAAFDRLDEDDELRVAILRGAGRAFSAGADRKEMADQAAGSEGDATPSLSQFAFHFNRCDELTKPIVAVMHGHAVGGGLELALCCDIRVAVAGALLGAPEPRTTNSRGEIALHRLARMIPVGEALLIKLTSQPITGERAYDVGLAQAIAPDIDAAMEIAERFADQMIECDPDALRGIKQVARWPLMSDIATSMRFSEVARSAARLRA